MILKIDDKNTHAAYAFYIRKLMLALSTSFNFHYRAITYIKRSLVMLASDNFAVLFRYHDFSDKPFSMPFFQ